LDLDWIVNPFWKLDLDFQSHICDGFGFDWQSTKSDWAIAWLRAIDEIIFFTNKMLILLIILFTERITIYNKQLKQNSKSKWQNYFGAVTGRVIVVGIEIFEHLWRHLRTTLLKSNQRPTISAPTVLEPSNFVMIIWTPSAALVFRTSPTTLFLRADWAICYLSEKEEVNFLSICDLLPIFVDKCTHIVFSYACMVYACMYTFS